MNQSKIRILCIMDNSLYQDISKFDMIVNAFSLVNEDYKIGTHEKVAIEPLWTSQDLSGLGWVPYNYPVFPDSYGVDFSWINQQTKKIWNERFDTIDCVMYFIDNLHWTSMGSRNIWGWSLGTTYNNYAVQFIRVGNILEATKLTISMENFHYLDFFLDKKFGIGFTNKLFGTKDWDEEVAHCKSCWLGGYRKEIEKMSDYLYQVFLPKEIKFKLIEILKNLVELYRKRILELSRKEEPVIFYHK